MQFKAIKKKDLLLAPTHFIPFHFMAHIVIWYIFCMLE